MSTDMLRIPLAGVSLLCLVSSGCDLVSHVVLPRGNRLTVPSYVVPSFPNTAHPFRAGVAVVDITPPPGYPTGGHGPAASLARGSWGRLQARAFAFVDRTGTVLILVSCDLFAVPGGLQASVARRVATGATARRLQLSLPPEAIVLAATHTHQGPGNYLTAAGLNAYGSTYPGFASELFDFFTDKLARVIDDSLDDAMSGQGAVTLQVRSAAVADDYRMGFVRNRSPRSFFLNWNAFETMTALHPGTPPAHCVSERRPDEPPDAWDLDECPRLRAADPVMTVLEVGRGQARIGVLVFFAVHPTVIPAETPLYSDDFVGYGIARLEEKWRMANSPAVAGFFNGAEGDITARRQRRDLRDVVDLGGRFASAVERVLAATATDIIGADPPAIMVKRTEVVPGPDVPCGQLPNPLTLAKEAVLGVAALGGAEDDHTLLYGLGWREHVLGRAVDGQGPKQPAFDSPIFRKLKLTRLILPSRAAPALLPFVWASFGDRFTFATTPFELSTMQGLDVRRHLGLAHGRFEIVGVANEYALYTVTPAEYAAQDYSAAATLWGPSQGPYVACQLAALRTEVAARAAGRRITEVATPAGERHIASRAYYPGADTETPFGADFVGQIRQSVDEELELVLRDARNRPHRLLPYFEWTVPQRVSCGTSSGADADARECWNDFDAFNGTRVEIVSTGGASDRTEHGVVTILRESPKKTGRRREWAWAAIWVTPLWNASIATSTAEFQFKVKGPDGETRCSRPFTVQRPGPPQGIPALASGPCS